MLVMKRCNKNKCIQYTLFQIEINSKENKIGKVIDTVWSGISILNTAVREGFTEVTFEQSLKECKEGLLHIQQENLWKEMPQLTVGGGT